MVKGKENVLLFLPVIVVHPDTSGIGTKQSCHTMYFFFRELFAALFPALPFFLLAAKERNKEKLPGIKDCLMPGCLSDIAILLLCCRAVVR